MMREELSNGGGYFTIEPTSKCDPYYHSGSGSYIGTIDHFFTEMHASKFCGALGTINDDDLYPHGYGVRASYQMSSPVTTQANDFLPTARAVTSYVGDRYKIQLTTANIKTKTALNAHLGLKGNNLLNSLPTVTVPSG